LCDINFKIATNASLNINKLNKILWRKLTMKL
jgi:hypothetical protein